MYRRAFTLIEVLVSVAIISLLIALIIPNIDRSLSKNNIANDANIFKAKLEEVRLLSGSHQVDDRLSPVLSTSQLNFRLYGILVHQGQHDFYSLINLYYSSCSPTAVINNSLTGVSPGNCIIEKVKLSQGVKLNSDSNQFIAFRSPNQQMFTYRPSDTGGWELSDPIFTKPAFRLTYQNKVANVEIGDFTGKVTITFTN